MNKNELFKQIVEEAKKEIIDPVIWILYFQFNVVDEITHAEYVKAIAERHKNNPKVLKQLEPYFELWKNEIK